MPHPMQHRLVKLNAALLTQDQTALGEALQDADLSALLAPDTIEFARQQDKRPLVIFLTTLAVHNDVEVQSAQRWLSCYQSLTGKKLMGELTALPPSHVLRETVSHLITQEKSIQNQPLSGNLSDWTCALELAMDCKNWPWVQHLQKQASRQLLGEQLHQDVWLALCKTLAARFQLLMDTMGQSPAEIDHHRLHVIYGACAQFMDMLGQQEARISFEQIQAKFLENAREYRQAIDLLQQIAARAPSEYQSCQIQIAQSHCKSGDLTAAIEAMDQAIERLMMPTLAHRRTDTSEDLPAAESMNKEDIHFDVHDASRALADLAMVLEAHQIPFFLVSGTLLGYVRNGSLLPHDKDIDIGILGWEKQYDIGMALLKTGQFDLPVGLLKGEKLYLVPVSHIETGVTIDLFFYHPQGDKVVTGVDFFFGHQQTFAFTPFELKKVQFLGAPIYIPENYDLNLRENYGNWQVPDKVYQSHLESPSTLNAGGADHMLTARLVLHTALQKKQYAKVARVAQILRKHATSAWSMPAKTQALLTQWLEQHASDPSSVAIANQAEELAHV